jgi:hypothetical protein
MAEPTSPKNPNPSWKKLLLVAVLGAVLLYVVTSPSDQGTSPTLVARPPEQRPTIPSVSSNAMAKPVPGSTTGAVTWPATPLADVLAFNPFKMPAELKPPVAPVTEETPLSLAPAADLNELDAAQAAELREALKGQRLTALVQTSKGIGAIVGEAVVTVGDLVGERLRVTAIRPDGVLLELIDKPATTDGKNGK